MFRLACVLAHSDLPCVGFRFTKAVCLQVVAPSAHHSGDGGALEASTCLTAACGEGCSLILH